MPAFGIREAFDGTAMGFSANYPGIEIVMEPGHLKEHGQTYTLMGPLATFQEIDHAIDALTADLEALRSAAKQMLESYKQRAQSRGRKS